MATHTLSFILLVIIFTDTIGIKVDIELAHPHAHVEPEFLSVTLDSSILGPPKWRSFSFSSPRVQTLLKGLSPAYLRLEGNAADNTVYSNDPSPINHVLNSSDIDNIVMLMRKTNFKFLLDLNLQLRYGIQCNPTNAASLLAYVKKMNYSDVFNFELGNEPDLFHEARRGYVNLSGTRIAKDFNILHNLLTEYNFTKYTFVGPDAANVVSADAIKLFKEFIEGAGKLLTAATFHHYYFDGRKAHLSEYTKVQNFDEYESRIKIVQELIKKSGTPHLPLWLGEGASSFGGGGTNISDRFVSGFLCLDKLGISAKEGMGVVMRQTFNKGNNALTDSNNMPNPDYWLSYVHKRLVGQKVLKVSPSTIPAELHMDWSWRSLWYSTNSSNLSKEIRVYAHCTLPSSKYGKGSVTVFGLSLKTSGHETLTFQAPLSRQTVHIYLLTPAGTAGLKSKFTALNGKTLKMIDDRTLPELVPVQQSASQEIRLPALTFGFFVFPNANAAACK